MQSKPISGRFFVNHIENNRDYTVASCYEVAIEWTGTYTPADRDADVATVSVGEIVICKECRIGAQSGITLTPVEVSAEKAAEIIAKIAIRKQKESSFNHRLWERAGYELNKAVGRDLERLESSDVEGKELLDDIEIHECAELAIA